jgi:hypothetical protein
MIRMGYFTCVCVCVICGVTKSLVEMICYINDCGIGYASVGSCCN